MSSSQTPSTFGLHWSQALRAALAAKVTSLPPSGVQGVVVAIYGREILALKRTWHASSIDFAELHDFSCDRAADALLAAEARLARAIATMPADAWVEVAGYGGVGVAVSLRCCSAQLRLGPNIFASVFADATRERFPAMALAVVAANGRESDHEAIYKSLHEAVASRLSPRPLVLLAPPLPQRDQFAFTVEIIHFDKVVISTTASIPDNTSLCTSRLYTPPLSFDRIVDQDGRVRDPVSARVFCVNMTTGHATLIYNEALTQKTVISHSDGTLIRRYAQRIVGPCCQLPVRDVILAEDAPADERALLRAVQFQGLYLQGLHSAQHGIRNFIKLRSTSRGRLKVEFTVNSTNGVSLDNFAFQLTHLSPILESLLIFLTLFLDFNIPVLKSA